MVKFRYRKDWSIGRVITKIVAVVLGLWVGDKVLQAINNNLGNVSENLFASGFEFLGLEGDGGISSTSILGVLGIVGAASVVMEFVEIRM